MILKSASDVRKPTTTVAASSVMSCIRDVATAPYHNASQDADQDYYMQFQPTICGLGGVEARRWITATS
ncbi:hypothetical protein HOY80DRAFT_952714, partial [Tuber brumale]